MDGARPRRPRTFYQRINPMIRYDEQKFRERYRLPKVTVQQLAADYAASGMCTTQLDARGGGLSAEERVSSDTHTTTQRHINLVKSTM